MYLLAHLGIGYAMVEAWPLARRAKLPKTAILLGTVLPDLIDKPLFFAMTLLLGREHATETMIAGTRSFGHTLLFFLALSLIARFRKSKWLFALSLGTLTHLVLDALSDLLISHWSYFNYQGLLWPAFGWKFPVTPFPSFGAQLAYWTQPVPLISETVGLAALLIVGYMNWSKVRGDS